MTEYVHAAILGIIQGIAEFLPISSSGHLVIVGELLNQFSGTTVPVESATMSIALHFGTLLSILVVYRRELPAIIRDSVLLRMIVLATVPVGVAGVFFKTQIETAFSTPLLAGEALIVTAVFLLIGHHLQHRRQVTTNLSAASAGMIGVFQAIAIIPGISRSGSTIAAGLAVGLTREQAARFSFLIAIPAIGGAAAVKARDLVSGQVPVDSNLVPVALGTVISFVVGIVTLRWLLRIVAADRLRWFAGYCLVAGVATILWQLSGTADSLGTATAPATVEQPVAALFR